MIFLKLSLCYCPFLYDFSLSVYSLFFFPWIILSSISWSLGTSLVLKNGKEFVCAYDVCVCVCVFTGRREHRDGMSGNSEPQQLAGE